MDEAILYPLDYQLTLARVIRQTLQGRAMQEALSRLNRADFGQCAACGAVIPYLEVRADPTVRHCADCRLDHPQ